MPVVHRADDESHDQPEQWQRKWAGVGGGGCTVMDKEKSALGPISKTSPSSQLHHAGTKDMQPLRDTSQNHSKGAHPRKEGFKAVTGLLVPPMC